LGPGCRAPIELVCSPAQPLASGAVLQQVAASNHVNQYRRKLVACGLAQARVRERKRDQRAKCWKCPGSQLVETKSKPRKPDVVVVHAAVYCRDVYGVALFVHKCIKIADATAVAAARQQPR
jgi:hypothetical protein